MIKPAGMHGGAAGILAAPAAPRWPPAAPEKISAESRQAAAPAANSA